MTQTLAVFMAIYVDDIAVTGIDSAEIESLKSFLHKQFKIKDLVQLYYFLWMKILYKSDGVFDFTKKIYYRIAIRIWLFELLNCLIPSWLQVKLKSNKEAFLAYPSSYRRIRRYNLGWKVEFSCQY